MSFAAIAYYLGQQGKPSLVLIVHKLLHLLPEWVSQEPEALHGSQSMVSPCSLHNCVGPVANLCGAALEKANDGQEAMEKALDQSGAIEMASMEKNMTWISLCIATAPMLGFLGTVWGMIQAFNDIKMANDISPAVVAGGISVALLTTAFGLVVAVVLQILQNAVMYIIDNQIVVLQKSTTMLLNSAPKKK